VQAGISLYQVYRIQPVVVEKQTTTAADRENFLIEESAAPSNHQQPQLQDLEVTKPDKS